MGAKIAWIFWEVLPCASVLAHSFSHSFYCKASHKSRLERPPNLPKRVRWREPLSPLIPDCLPGSYFLIARSVSNGTELQTRVPVDVTNSDVNGLTVTLTPGIDIQGQVGTAGGKLDLSGVHLFLQPRDQSIYFSSETDSPDRNGNVTFHHVGDGSYKLQVWGLPPDAYLKSILLNGQDARTDGFDVNEGQSPGTLEIVIDSNGGRVSGTVLKDDKPFNNAQVALLPESDKAQKDSDLTKETTTDQYGVFVIRGIRPGTYRVMAFEQIEEGAWTDPNFMVRLPKV